MDMGLGLVGVVTREGFCIQGFSEDRHKSPCFFTIKLHSFFDAAALYMSSSVCFSPTYFFFNFLKEV